MPTSANLIYVGATTGTYANPLTLAALLTDTSGNGLAGRNLVLSFGNQTLTATTDANGLAKTTFTVGTTQGVSNATINFAGDVNTGPVQVTQAINIAKEATLLTFNGSLPGGSAPQQIVSATLSDPFTGGPIANATVQFNFGAVSITSTTNSSGLVTATLNLTVAQTLSNITALQISFGGDTNRLPANLIVPTSLYFGFAFGAAIVRHVPAINGNGLVQGNIRQLNAEGINLNSGAVINGDFLVPGSPNLNINGHPTFAGVVTGTGSVTPTGYSVNLNDGVQLGHLIIRTDPIAMPTVATPPTPTGNRDVNINNPGQSVGDFSTLRNLNLNSNVGAVAVPPGTYGQFSVNSGSSLILGVAGSSQPVVYNLQALNLNSSLGIGLVGPVIINLANQVALSGNVGSQANPWWLTLNVASGGLNLNSNSNFYGLMRVPNGAVIINSQSLLQGSVWADSLTVNSGGTLRGAAASNGSGSAPLLKAVQTAPTSTLPGQRFGIGLNITDTSAIGVTNVTVQESSAGTTPVTATAIMGNIGGGGAATTSFTPTVSVLSATTTPRGSIETSSAYQTRLGAADGQGSTRALVDGSGNIRSSELYTYDAFGNLISGQTNLATSYLYTGQQFDALTSLYSLRARYYNPNDGRFVSRDINNIDSNNPIELNRYVYTSNNSINKIDPNGRELEEYGALNQNSNQEKSATAEVGSGTADTLAEEVAQNNAIEARSIYENTLGDLKYGQRHLTIGRSDIIVNGEKRSILAVNNFGTQREVRAASEAISRLKQVAQEKGWEFEGGELASNVPSEEHAERLIINWARGLGENNRIPIGISNPLGACSTCTTAASNLLEQGLHVIISFLS